jgi:hypothetical protein
MYCILWRYETAPFCEAEFRAAYGPNGEWAKLFARGEGFLACELYEDATQPGRFLTIDRWARAENFEAFKAAHGADYDTLDRAFAALTVRQQRLGAFETE